MPAIQHIRHIHALLGNLGIRDQKADLVFEVSQGRTESTADLTDLEATELISHLRSFTTEQKVGNSKLTKEQFDAGQTKRRRILSICHQLPTEKGFTKFDEAKKIRVIDFIRLDQFLSGPQSIYKKGLNFHTANELSRVIVQFENMLKGYLK